jgi:uncharacterized protein
VEQLFIKNRILLSNLNPLFRRGLLDKIAWNERLIGIKGARGIGKTTLILQRIKENFAFSDECLYVNMDDLNFPYSNLVELADVFSKNGGRYLFIDEIHKQNLWIQQLKNIYDTYQQLNIVFTGSSILELDNSKADLSRRAVMYNMRGLSFREYLELESSYKFECISLNEIITNHEKISAEIVSKCKPLKYFLQYLKYGYFPYYLQNKETYLIKLSEVINQIIEFDLPYIADLDMEHVSKIKRFLYLLSQYVPVKPNISNLSAQMQMSRATVSNYLHYLNKADILLSLYPSDHQMKSIAKPEKILLHHPNLNFALSSQVNTGSIRESFFVNQLSGQHEVKIPKHGDFIIDNQFVFEIGGKSKTFGQIKDIGNSFLAIDDIEFGIKNKIPLWLFGFLY